MKLIFALALSILACLSIHAQTLQGDAAQVGENQSNGFLFTTFAYGPGKVDTLGTFQKTFTNPEHVYRVGVFNDVLLDPGASLITVPYLNFGSYSRVSITADQSINTSGSVSEIFGSYSSAHNSGQGDFSGRAFGAKLEAVDDHVVGSTWGATGADISATLMGKMPKFGSVGAGINLINNTTIAQPGANPFHFAISAAVTNNSNVNVTEQAVITVKNLGGQGTGLVPDMYGIRISQPSTAYGTKVTNNIGLFIADHSTIGSGNKYNVYSIGINSKNYFQGGVQVDGEVKLSSQCRGVAQMASGINVVSSTCVHTGSTVMVTRQSSTHDLVTYSYGSIVDGVSFTIRSSDMLDNHQVSWLVIN